MIPTFNNDGPIGTFFRYICDNGTYIARYDDLVDDYDKPVDLSGVVVSDNGIELEDREFFSTVSRASRRRASSLADGPALDWVYICSHSRATHEEVAR